MVFDHGSSTPEKLHSTLFWPNLLSSKSLIIQVSLSNKSFLKQTPPLSTNLGFSFPVLNPGWKVFSLTIFTLYDLLVFLPVPLISWEVFHWLTPCPIFLLSFPIIGLGGFFTSNMTLWDSSACLRGYDVFSSLPIFLPSLSHWFGRFFTRFPFFSSMFPQLAELASEKRSNCNNATLGARAESSQSGSHVITIIQNFTLVSLASTATPHPAGLPFGAIAPSHPTHSTTYSTSYCLRSRKVFPTVGTICVLPTYRGMRIIISQASLDSVEFERLVGHNQVRSSLVQTSASSSKVYWRANKGSPLVCHRYWSGLLARWHRNAFGMSSGLMTNNWHQRVIVTPGLWLEGWRSWQVTRDNQTWRWSRLEWFWSDWELGSLPCSSR